MATALADLSLVIPPSPVGRRGAVLLSKEERVSVEVATKALQSIAESPARRNALANTPVRLHVELDDEDEDEVVFHSDSSAASSPSDSSAMQSPTSDVSTPSPKVADEKPRKLGARKLAGAVAIGAIYAIASAASFASDGMDNGRISARGQRAMHNYLNN